MLIDIRKVAHGLRNLADEIAMHDRTVEAVEWYWPPALDDERLPPAPIVPRAIHDALCPALSVLLQDEEREIVICDRCSLAVEDSAS